MKDKVWQVFPTHVGVNRPLRAGGATNQSIPHTRGGEPNFRIRIFGAVLYSPHTWGHIKSAAVNDYGAFDVSYQSVANPPATALLMAHNRLWYLFPLEIIHLPSKATHAGDNRPQRPR